LISRRTTAAPMAEKFTWTGVIKETKVDSKKKVRASKAKSYQDFCDDLYNMGDLLSCYIFDTMGNVRGKQYGKIEVTEDLKQHFAEIAAVIWGGLKSVEPVGGSINFVDANFENFKILGIPMPALDIGILAVIPVELDSLAMKERILDYVRFWKGTWTK